MKKFIFVFLLVFGIKFSFSQRNNLWVEGGSGAFVHQTDKFGISVGAGLNYLQKDNLFSGKIIVNYEYFLADNFVNFGILYGKMFRDDFFAFSASLGFGYVNGKQSLDGINGKVILKISGISADFEINANIIGLKYVGMGIKFFANINSDYPMLGFLWTYQIGLIK